VLGRRSRGYGRAVLTTAGCEWFGGGSWLYLDWMDAENIGAEILDLVVFEQDAD